MLRKLSSRFKILQPLSIRDFALLWTGLTVSGTGDGITLVALAWQVYELSNAPTAMSVVGVSWSLPMVVFLLLGGVVSDRFDRRSVMIASDVVRGAAVASIGALSIADALELWHVWVLIGVYGAGEAFFGPAFGAIVPDIVPKAQLVAANSLEQLVRPATFQLVGPALGGLAIAALGGDVGYVFLADAATFAFSAACLTAMRARSVRVLDPGERPSALREIAEGLRFVRSQTWCWATLAMAALVLLCYIGPFDVLLPYVVKNELGGGADDLGLVFAVGGVGAIMASLLMAQRGLPRRHMRFMYVAFGLEAGALALYAFATEAWHAMAVAMFASACATSGMVVWGTLMHALVPAHLQGRVRSLDWLVSIGLVPLSFAITGPMAETIGVDTTLIGAGVLGAAGCLLFMFVPGLYDTEADGRLAALDAADEPAAPETATL